MKNNQKRSLRALDWLNFFMADVNTGIGPFLVIYLTATPLERGERRYGGTINVR